MAAMGSGLRLVDCSDKRGLSGSRVDRSTTHGTLPWKGAQERRCVLFRYTPKLLHYSGGLENAPRAGQLPGWAEGLSEAERAVLEPPYAYSRPLVGDDGVTVVRRNAADCLPFVW